MPNQKDVIDEVIDDSRLNTWLADHAMNMNPTDALGFMPTMHMAHTMRLIDRMLKRYKCHLKIVFDDVTSGTETPTWAARFFDSVEQTFEGSETGGTMMMAVCLAARTCLQDLAQLKARLP